MIQQELPTRQRLIRLIRESGGATLPASPPGKPPPGGPPPLMSRLPPQAELASPETYLTFLRAVFDALRSQGQERVDALFREIAERVAAQHPETRALPAMSARL